MQAKLLPPRQINRPFSGEPHAVMKFVVPSITIQGMISENRPISSESQSGDSNGIPGDECKSRIGLTKRCKTCLAVKATQEFPDSGHSKTGKRKVRASCKTCWNEKMRPRSKRHYQDNPDYYRERNRRAVKKARDLVRAIKEDNPCTDCGEFYPYYVMQFDHLRDKKHGVAKLLSAGRIQQILREIEKCELVCANCHAARTHKRRS